MDLHYSQTLELTITSIFMFESPMDLHYSQTEDGLTQMADGLNPLWIYTTLKLIDFLFQLLHRLNPLWIYTTLKQMLMQSQVQLV